MASVVILGLSSVGLIIFFLYLASIFEKRKPGNVLNIYKTNKRQKKTRSVTKNFGMNSDYKEDPMAINFNQSIKTFNSILECAPDAMVITNEDGIIVMINSQTEIIFGFKKMEIIGKPVEVLIPERFHKHVAHRTVYLSAPHVRPMGSGLELYGLRKNKSEFPVEISLSSVKTDSGILALATIRDITDKKNIEKILIKKNAQVEKANKFLEETFKKQKILENELIKSNSELEQFAYVVSHDLKAPLRAIDRLATWIEEDNADTLESKSKDNLVLLRQRANRMSQLISGILEYSRVGHGDLQTHSVNTKSLLQVIIDNLNSSQKFNIHFADNLPTFEADEVQLGQVFSNLIDNSIKHHHQKTGTIEIGVHDSDNFYEFFVQDDGPGIEPEYHEKIFQIFQTLKARDELESTGIGLSIVKKIIESQGGKITLHSALGEGATFYFTWPKNRNIK